MKKMFLIVLLAFGAVSVSFGFGDCIEQCASIELDDVKCLAQCEEKMIKCIECTRENPTEECPVCDGLGELGTKPGERPGEIPGEIIPN